MALNADQRGGITSSGKPSYTVSQAAVQIDRQGGSWGAGATVTYSFANTYIASTLQHGIGGIQSFNTTQMAAAEAALAAWADVANIKFTRLGGTGYSSAGQITFQNYTTGYTAAAAFAGFPRSGQGVWVNYAQTSNNTTNGLALGGYGRQTLLHEIGHQLGLSHPGNYDADAGTPTYAADAAYYEDSRQYTVMSYFSESMTGGNFGGFSAAGPMMDDIAAIQRIYGANMTTRTGNSIYGFNSNTGVDYYTATSSASKLVFSVWDAGGNDTFDFSGYSSGQNINLNPGTFSDVGGLTGNVSIALGVTIENAIGGSNVDRIIGNTADNIITGGLGADTLTGGGGADIFRDTAAGLNGDTITDFTTGDKINITNIGASSIGTSALTYSLNGHTLSFASGSSSGSVTLTNVPKGHLIAKADATSGIDLVIQATVVHNDFNGDGRSDILWRSDGSQVSNWLANANGGFTGNDANAFSSVPSSWKVVGTGDFNGDGYADLLWRNSNGQLSDWLGKSNGGFTGNDSSALTSAPTSWHVVGTGDFNGDGRADILWRSDSGQLSDWLGNANGGFSGNDANAFTSAPTSWTVAGTGDFNGDGYTDILWRNSNGQLSDWLGKANGAFVSNDANAFNSAPTSWHIVGTGDFNGDGYDDILWRSDTGQLSDWLGKANGGFSSNDANALRSVPTNWAVADTGDYNGDGRTDILWRNDTGAMSDWFGTATGGFTNNDAAAYQQVVTNWHIQPHELLV